MHKCTHNCMPIHTQRTPTYTHMNKYKHTPTCSTPYTHSEVNAYIKSLTASKQVPPLRQGALKHSFTLTSQLSPPNPWAQVQVYPPARSLHTPLFRHGSDRHSLISSSQNTPFPRNEEKTLLGIGTLWQTYTVIGWLLIFGLLISQFDIALLQNGKCGQVWRFMKREKTYYKTL